MTASAQKLDPDNYPPSLEISLAGERLVCHWSGCLFLPEHKALIVSDMHLEKGSSFARRGMLIPPYDSTKTLSRLAAVAALYEPEMIVSLGDSFHDRHGHSRLSEAAQEKLSALMAGRQWFWVSGNHDPEPPDELGGEGVDELILGNLVLRHEPAKGSVNGEIAGHLHPAAKISRRGRAVRRICFVSDGRRLIMPAFGVYAGGLNLNHSAFDGLFQRDKLFAILLGNERVYQIPGALLSQ